MKKRKEEVEEFSKFFSRRLQSESNLVSFKLDFGSLPGRVAIPTAFGWRTCALLVPSRHRKERVAKGRERESIVVDEKMNKR